MNRIFALVLFYFLISGISTADDWDPNDDTFDPNIESVVIGDRTWIGDPSPFVHTGLPRTGYTYVTATQFEGFPPSVQISLMVPLAAGETVPPAGGMLMLDKTQTGQIVQAFSEALKADGKDAPKRFPIKTAIEDADWALVPATEQGQRYLQLEFKTAEKVDVYRFTINASKKLLGAIQHSQKQLDKKKDE